MNNLRNRIAQWMYNRYGLDKLSYALLVTYFVLALLNIFVKSTILNYVSMVMILVVFFRLFSKNKVRRGIENRLFEKYFNPIKAFLRLEERRFKEIKTHRFRRCPNCRTVLRLKKKIGIHQVKCPRCQREMSVRIRF